MSKYQRETVGAHLTSMSTGAQSNKCTLQFRPLFSQVHRNLNSIKVFNTSSCYKPPTCTHNGKLLNSSRTSRAQSTILQKRDKAGQRVQAFFLGGSYILGLGLV